MSASEPLLDTIEPDEPTEAPSGKISNSNSRNTNARASVVLTPTTRNEQMASTDSDAEAGTFSSTFVFILKC
jgi:hypothetical protein